MGMRSRAPPVADAARRSIRSGRKNRASEQREDFFGHRKAARTAICRGVRRRKSRCRAYGLNKQLFAQTAPPPPRGRGRGCGAERRQWRMQRGGAPAAVEKIEQASSAKIFSGTARRWGQMRLRLPWERICAQYGFRFFAPEKSKFVSSTASDRKGFVKGESVPLDRVLPTFARTKVGPRREGVLTTPLQKAARRRRRSQTGPRRIGEIKPSYSLCRQPLSQPCG